MARLNKTGSEHTGGGVWGGDHLWRKAAWASAFFFLRRAISDTRTRGSSKSALHSDLSSGGESSLFGMVGGREDWRWLAGRRRFKMAWKKEFESRARGEGRGVIELSERIYNPVRPAWPLLTSRASSRACYRVCCRVILDLHSFPTTAAPTASRNPAPIQSRPHPCAHTAMSGNTWACSCPDHLCVLPVQLLPLHIQHLHPRPVPIQHTHHPPSDPPVNRDRH